MNEPMVQLLRLMWSFPLIAPDIRIALDPPRGNMPGLVVKDALGNPIEYYAIDGENREDDTE